MAYACQNEQIKPRGEAKIQPGRKYVIGGQ